MPPAPMRETRPVDASRKWRLSWWLLVPIGLGLVACESVSPSVRGPRGTELVLPAPWLTPTAGWAAVVSLPALGVLAAVTRGRRGPGWVALVATAALFLGGAFLAAVRHNFGWRPFSDWTDADESLFVARDGTPWRAFGRRWLEGGLTLGRCERDGWFSSTWRLVAFGDLGTAGALVLPAGTDRSNVLVESNGHIAAMWSPGVRALVATVDGRVVAGSVPPTPERSGWMGVEDLSAFALIGPDDALDEESVRAIESTIVAHAASEFRTEYRAPRDDDLAEALDSPHAGIRDAAARFVRAGAGRPDLYPKASARLGR